MKKKPVNLNGFSKADLIWIVEYFVKWHGDFYLERAISDLKYRKELERIEEADRFAAIADKKRREYIDLLAPYEGKRWCDLPADVVRRATAAMKEAQAADKKYMSLMGIGGKQ